MGRCKAPQLLSEIVLLLGYEATPDLKLTSSIHPRGRRTL